MSLESLYGPDPPESDEILCPLCDAVADEFYISCDGDLLGCESCVDKTDAGEWMAKEKEAIEAEIGDRKYHEMKDNGEL